MACCMCTKQKYFQLHDQNAQLILNAPPTLHAYRRNVKTLACNLHVDRMQNVELETTAQHAHAEQAMKEIPTPSAQSVRLSQTKLTGVFTCKSFAFQLAVKVTLNAQMTRLASVVNVKILAILKPVVLMPTAKQKIIGQYVSALRITRVTHTANAGHMSV